MCMEHSDRNNNQLLVKNIEEKVNKIQTFEEKLWKCEEYINSLQY